MEDSKDLIKRSFSCGQENDTISRQAAIDAINCNITITGRQNAELVAATIGAFVDRIKALPSAPPEIIRCKDCRHWREQGLCGIWDQYISNDDFYCGCAERKEGEADD